MEHPFGMDELGRDLLSRIIYGARYTLGTATVAVLLSLLVGVPIGLFAGYRGGLTDMLLMRTIDALLSFPYFLVGIMLAAVLGGSLVTAVLAMGLTLIPNFARVTRGCVLGMRHNDYVLSAEAIGCKVPRILWRYVLPNVLAPLAVVATLNMATAILGVSALGFLGLGLQPPTSEWGLMLSNAKNALQVAPHTMVFPGLAIVLTVTATNLFGDYLRELIDPTMKT
jgi:ABC-type dipeptide/oligopeptide/nickel transport system permease subunit